MCDHRLDDSKGPPRSPGSARSQDRGERVLGQPPALEKILLHWNSNLSSRLWNFISGNNSSGLCLSTISKWTPRILMSLCGQAGWTVVVFCWFLFKVVTLYKRSLTCLLHIIECSLWCNRNYINTSTFYTISYGNANTVITDYNINSTSNIP